MLVDAPGEGRTYREAPEIDGIVSLPADLPVGSFVEVVVTGADGPDLVAEPARAAGTRGRSVASAPGRTGAGRPDERRDRAARRRRCRPAPPSGPRPCSPRPTAITVLRLLATPVVIALIMLWGASWFTFVFGGLLAMSDGIDGWLARKQGTTRSGAFLDPLADKVVVLGALVALVAKGIVWWLPVAIIAVREIAMSRLPLGGGPARRLHPGPQLGQAQDPPPGHRHRHVPGPTAGRPPVDPATPAIWVATAMTVFTGVQYFVDGRRAGPGPGGRSPALAAAGAVDGTSSAA